MNSLKTHYGLKKYNSIWQSEALFDHEQMNDDISFPKFLPITFAMKDCIHNHSGASGD